MAPTTPGWRATSVTTIWATDTFWRTEPRRGNTIAGNLGLGTKVTADGEGVLPTDTRAATFWITNPDNMIHDNVAAGSQGFGFWFALPASPTGLSTGQPDLPRTNPLRQFSDNVAHSNRRGGLQVDDGPMAGREHADDLLQSALRSERRWRARSRPTSRISLPGSTPVGPSGCAAPTSSSRARCWPTMPSAPRSHRTRRSVERRTLRRRDGQQLQHAVLRHPAPRVRVLRRHGGRRPGEVRQLTAPPGRSHRAPSGICATMGSPSAPPTSPARCSSPTPIPYYLETPHADKDGDKAAVFLDRDGAVTGAPGLTSCPTRRFW